MSHDCPAIGCYKQEETMEELNDHVSRDHDLFTAVVTGEAMVVPTELYDALVQSAGDVTPAERVKIRADGGESE